MARSSTTYSDVADYLIADMNVQNSKEEKNIRRRVYDALNVLKSARVIKKTGKTVTWNSFLPTPCRMTIVVDQ
jgi:transcription factor Dp